MVVGRQVSHQRRLLRMRKKSGNDEFYANYLIAERAALIAAGPPTAPSPAFTSVHDLPAAGGWTRWP